MTTQLAFEITPRFFHELEEVGATSLRLLSEAEALNLASLVASYTFTKQPEKYGTRNVTQHFSACEEEDIPQNSLVRILSQSVERGLKKIVSVHRSDFFIPPLTLNDHLLLKYEGGEIGLGLHRDQSKYLNLIISLTLSGKAKFNIYPEVTEQPKKVFDSSPGIAVFMRAPGFLGEDIRPFHSVTQVSESRISLIFKQRKV